MLGEQYFKNTTWPSVENIESMIPNGIRFFLHFFKLFGFIVLIKKSLFVQKKRVNKINIFDIV